MAQQRREELTDAIWKYFKASEFVYGSPRVVLDLWEAGWTVSVNTVAQIMAEHTWVGRERRPRRNLTRQGKHAAPADRASATTPRRARIRCGAGM